MAAGSRQPHGVSVAVRRLAAGNPGGARAPGEGRGRVADRSYKAEPFSLSFGRVSYGWLDSTRSFIRSRSFASIFGPVIAIKGVMSRVMKEGLITSIDFESLAPPFDGVTSKTCRT